MQIIPGTTGLELAKLLAEKTSWSLLIPEYKNFKDGETYIRLTDTPESHVLVIQSLYEPQEENLFILLNLIMTLKKMGVEKIYSFVPYLCYARSDRVVKPGEAVSGKNVLQLLEFAGIDKLFITDIHNPDILDVVNKMGVISFYPTLSIANYIRNKFNNEILDEYLIVAPDEGAIERAKVLATRFNTSWTNMKKSRHPDDGSISVSFEQDIDKEKVILVDDIMSTGQSLILASNLLKLRGATQINVVVSHLIGVEAIDQLKEIGQGFVVSTKSIPNPIAEIDMLDDLLDAL